MRNVPCARAGSLAVVVLLIAPACVEEEPPPPPPASCARDIECGMGLTCVVEEGAARGECRQVFCVDDSDCSGGERCHAQADVCLAPLACVVDADCDDGERCLIEGREARCASPDDVQGSGACALVPRTGALVEGAVTMVDVMPLGVSGRLASAGAFTVESDAGELAGSGPFGYQAACAGAAPCRVELRALDPGGALACATSLLVLPPAPDAALRVVLVDESDGRGVADALVFVRTADGTLEGRTDDDGVALFEDVSSQVLAVSALPDEHDWHSVVGPASADLLLVTRPSVRHDEVAGVRASAEFSDVKTQGDIALAIGGLSLERGLSGRPSLAALFGPVVTRTLDIDPLIGPTNVALPLGAELLIGANPVQGELIGFSRPGTRVAWSVVGRIRLADVGTVLGASTFGQGLGALLLFASRFDHTVGPVVAVDKAPRPTSDDVPSEQWPLPLLGPERFSGKVFPRLHLDVDVPLLPCAAGAGDGDCARLPSALVALSALTPLGQVPLGFAHDEDDPDTRDDVVVRDGRVGADGALSLLFAPPHDGLEPAPRVLTTVAFEIERAFDDGGVSFTQRVAPADGTNDEGAVPFLPLAQGSFAQGASSGTLALMTPAEGADLHRFHLVGGDGAEWHVWLAGETTSASLEELLPAGLAPRHATAALQAIDLGEVLPGEAPVDAAGLFAPDGTSLAELRRYTRRFSSAPCLLAGGAPSACVTVDE